MPNLKDAYFLDCGRSYSGVATTKVGGLNHLEGETVKVIADGKVHPDKVVTSGAVTLDYAASDIHVGLGYTSKLETMPIASSAQDGTTMGRLAEVPKVIMLVSESVGMDIGPDESNLDTVMFTYDDVYASKTTLFTGAIDVNIESGHDRQPRVRVHHSEALPLNLNALIAEYEVTQ